MAKEIIDKGIKGKIEEIYEMEEDPRFATLQFERLEWLMDDGQNHHKFEPHFLAEQFFPCAFLHP